MPSDRAGAVNGTGRPAATVCVAVLRAVALVIDLDHARLVDRHIEGRRRVVGQVVTLHARVAGRGRARPKPGPGVMFPETTVVVAVFAMSGATPLPSRTSCDGPDAVVTVAAARNGSPCGMPPLLVRMMSVIRGRGERARQDERLHVEANLAVAE